MFIQALAVYLTVTALFFFHYFMGNALTDRPLIVGTAVGLILGDMRTGIMVGASYELIFLGITNAGGVVPANTALGTSIGVAFTILTGMDSEASLAIAVPVALLGAQLITLMYTVRSVMNPYIEKLIDRGEYKKIEWFIWIQALVSYLVIFFPVFLVIAFGTDFVDAIIKMLPAFITGGLSVASGMLAAVGFGMLLKMVWAKSLAPYFFVGYVLAAYLGLPILGVALCGTLYAVIHIYGQREKGVAVAVKENGEEALFDD